MKVIHTENAPQAIGPYSQAILVKDTLYISGQLPLDPKTLDIVGPTSIDAQTKQALTNIEAICMQASMKKENIVKCSVLMQDLSQFNQMNEIYEAFFEGHKPARVAYEVSRLPKGVLIEIDAIAVK